ncbi:MAG: LptF/LptG family permease, partial [Candidatus Cloacimonadaceae bacterium]
MMVLKRYILKEHIAPFFLSLMVVTFVLLIDRVIDLLNTIIEKKLDIGTILEVFGLSMPFMLALSIPMAVLVATILAFGRMTVDRETIAMKASGINIYRMTSLLILAAVLLTGAMMYFNHYTLPETNHKLKNLMLKIAYYKPMTIIKPGEFTNITDYTIYVKENLGTELRGIVIFDRTETRYPKTIYAQSGMISQLDNGNTL